MTNLKRHEKSVSYFRKNDPCYFRIKQPFQRAAPIVGVGKWRREWRGGMEGAMEGGK